MPFTFAHPALIIPLCYAQRRYRWISVTGLITGSVAPDFEKFFRLKLASGYSHTIASIFYFSCPVALGLAFVFHLLVRRPLLVHLPSALYWRLSKYQEFDWSGHFRRCYWGVLLSIIVGATLHLFWDSFTHFHVAMNRVLPALTRPLHFGYRIVPVYQLIGLISSALGLSTILLTIWLMPVYSIGSAPTPTAMRYYWGIVMIVAITLTMVRILAVRPRLLDDGITAISAALTGLIIASILTYRRRVTQE